MEFQMESTSEIPLSVVSACCISIAEHQSENPEKGTQTLSLLPKYLSVLSNNPKSTVDQKSTSLEARNTFFSTFCSIEWSARNIEEIIKTCKDIVLSEAELKQVIQNAFKTIEKMKVTDLAPIINQMLSLSTKGCRAIVLYWLINFYNSIELTPEVLSSQQTILLHMNYIVTQDQLLGKEIIKICKMVEMSRFSMTLLFSIVSCPSFKEMSLRIIKSLLVTDWLDSTRDALLPNTTKPSPSLKSIISDIATSSAKGLDGLIVNFVTIGFYLMEIKNGFVNKIGSDLIAQIHQIHSSVRSEVFSLLTTRFMTKHEKIEIFIDLLHEIIKNGNVEGNGKIKELIDYMMMLTPAQAAKSFEALEPIYTSTPEILDYLILVTRKCFSLRDESSRTIGILGFVQLIKSKKRAKEVDFELLSYLQRGFNHSDPKTKRHLYHGFYEIVKAKPELRETVLNYLHFQLEKYWNEKLSSGRLNFEKCIFKGNDTLALSEPLPFLLYSIIKILEVTKLEHKITEIVENIRLCIIKAPLDDFDLDGQTDFSTSSDGNEHRLIAGTILGVLSVFMEYVRDDPEAIDSLYTLNNRLSDLVKSKSKVKKGEKKISFVPEEYTPELSTKWTLEMLRIVTTESDSPLSSNSRFKMYLLEQVSDQIDGITTVQTLCDMSSWLWILMLNHWDGVTDTKKSKKSFSFLVSETFYRGFEKIRAFKTQDAIRKWFTAIHQSSDPSDVFAEFVRESVVLMQLQAEDFLQNQRLNDVKVCLDIIFSLLCWTSGLTSHLLWITKIAKENEMDVLPVVASVINVYCRLCFMNDEISEIKSLVKDIRNINGERNDVEGTTQTGKVTHQIIDNQTTEHVCMTILSNINELVEYLQHLFEKTLQSYSREEHDKTIDPSVRQQHQERLYSHLASTCRLLQPLMQATLEASSINLYQSCQKIYHLLSIMTKFVCLECKETKKVNSVFEELIDSMRTSVHQYIYTSVAWYNDQSHKQENKVSKLQKEARIMPELIFSIEEWEKELIKLSELSGINFMKEFKRSKARSFQIDMKEFKSKKSTGSSIEVEDESSRDFEMVIEKRPRSASKDEEEPTKVKKRKEKKNDTDQSLDTPTEVVKKKEKSKKKKVEKEDRK
jgi:Fanconi anemia group I protein